MITDTLEPRVPNVELPRFTVPDWDEHYINLNARIVAGEPAVAMVDALCSAAPRTVAADIEAKGLSGRDWMSITCVSAAWNDPHSNRIVAVVLNPLREPRDRALLLRIFDHAKDIAFHGSTYDLPPLYAHRLVSIAHVNKVVDTLILGTLAYPSKFTPKKLETLSSLLIADVSDSNLNISELFSTRGFKKDEGYANVDIDSRAYIRGSASDTVQTLRLIDILTTKIVSWLTTDTPMSNYTAEDAHTLIEKLTTVNRVMLRRSVRGIRCDLEYAEKYRSQAAADKENADRFLLSEGITPGNGQHLVNKLEALGDLPAKWPRTETGLLSATKDSLEMLGNHPLVLAHRCTADTKRIHDYLDKVTEMMAITGRLHPRAKILGAESTGRMSYSDPPLQQFSELARPILIDDNQGLTSIDWSAIEPLVMGAAAHDWDFLASYSAGGDLYQPIVELAKIDRKVAKVVLLALMYGQGVTSLAARLGVTEDESRALRRRVLDAMPATDRFMNRIRNKAEETGFAVTMGNRILPIPRSSNKHKSGFASNSRYASYLAVNWFCQGSAADMLYDTVVEVEKAGYGDDIYLLMHDELVVSTPAAEAIKEIMRTPPANLVNWAGRVPVVNVDRNDMGRSWLKV